MAHRSIESLDSCVISGKQSILKRWLVIVPVLASGLVLWLWLSTPPRQNAVLPDGSVLTLREVSYGTKHRHAFGPLWQRLYTLIPNKLRGARSYNVGIFTNSEPFVAFWFTRDNTPSAPPFSSLRYYLEDAQGYAAGFESHSWNTTVRWPQTALGLGFSTWPRREEELRLGVYRVSTNGVLERITGFTVGNPAPRSHPTWTAPALPVSNSVADYEFRLVQLLVGATADGGENPKPSADPNESRVIAHFRASREGRPTRSWGPAGMTLSDAMGNEIKVGSWGLSSGDGEYRMKFKSSLWPSEPWKMRVEFSRTANYSRNELVPFPPIAVPAELLSGKTTNTFAVNTSTNWQDVPLTITAFQGLSRNFSTPALRLRCGTLPAAHRLTLVKIEDDKGRNVSAGGSTSDNQEYGYSLRLAPDSTRLHLTFAIHKSLFAEFVAQPTLVTPVATKAVSR
jgi:hypothetical protein